MSEGFERVKRRNKDSVMNAAQELFRVHGIKKVSMHDVANKAGVSPATIYNHFENKQDLVNQVVLMQLRQLVDLYIAEMHSDKPYFERLENSLFNEDQFIAGMSGEIGKEAAFRQLRTKSSKSFSWYEEARQALWDFIEEGKEKGYIDKNANNDNLMIFLEIVWRGITSVAYGEELLRRKDIIHDIISYIFKSAAGTYENPPG